MTHVYARLSLLLNVAQFGAPHMGPISQTRGQKVLLCDVSLYIYIELNYILYFCFARREGGICVISVTRALQSAVELRALRGELHVDSKVTRIAGPRLSFAVFVGCCLRSWHF